MRVSWLATAVLLCACNRQAAPPAAHDEPEPPLVEATPAAAAHTGAPLRIERMTIRRADTDAGPAQAGVLVRGQTLTVELDVAGAKARLAGVVRVGGAEIGLEPAPLPQTPAAGQKTHVGWQFAVPQSAATGRQDLEVEVSEGDGVSSIHRPVVVR